MFLLKLDRDTLFRVIRVLVSECEHFYDADKCYICYLEQYCERVRKYSELK